MKKVKILPLLMAMLLLAATGCSEIKEPDAPGDAVGTSEYQQVASDTGNEDPHEETDQTTQSNLPDFDPVLAPLSDPQTRCALTSSAQMVETESGYYMLYSEFLFYADKSDLTLWVPVCAKPNCNHQKNSCYAAGISNIWEKDGKLYGLTRSGVGVFIEIAMDGSYREVTYEESYLDPTADRITVEFGNSKGWCLLATQMQKDGTWLNDVLVLTDEGAEVLTSLNYPGSNTWGNFAWISNRTFSIRGDFLLRSQIPLAGEEDADKEDWISREYDLMYRICDGEIRPVSWGEDCDVYGSYIDGDIMYHFHHDDGFYCMNLATGEEGKLADAAWAGSRGFWVDGCMMIEMTFSFNDKVSTAEAPLLRYYDGSQWHEVRLPEEHGCNDCFNLVAVTSDRIFFTIEDTDADWEDSTTTLYCVTIGEEELLECNVFPTRIILEDG